MFARSDQGKAWTTLDYLHHYQFGNGAPLTLRETGNLVIVVEKYLSVVKDRLPSQIASAARVNGAGGFSYSFSNTYYMESVVFALGKTTIRGLFEGEAEPAGSGLRIDGRLAFALRDWFADPVDIGLESPGSTIYPISDDWGGTLSGWVESDASKSRYRWP